MKNRLIILSLLSLTLILLGCASKPVLYPNSKLEKVGKEAAQEDVNLCMEKADKFLESPRAKKVLKSAGTGSLVGSATGLITGLLTGDVVGGIASGAAIGAASGAAVGAITPDRLREAYVNRCLRRKGYEILGWD